MIACVIVLDMVSLVECQLINSAFKHVILTNPFGKVQGASAGVVKYGVRSGMRQRQAHALYPDAVVKPFDETPYRELAEAIAEALRVFTLKVEPVTGFWNARKHKRQDNLHPSAAIHYLDLGRQLRADAISITGKINDMLVTQFRTHPYIGLARGKYPASMAARFAKPERPKLIYPGQEIEFLARLPVTFLPLDKAISRNFQLLGIRTIGQFAELPAGAVLAHFGKRGRFLHQLAQGYDNRPVIAQMPKPVERIKRSFEGAIEDRNGLETVLYEMGCEIEQRLRQREFTTRSLELTLQLDGGKKLRTSRILREPTKDCRLIGRTLLRLLSQLEIKAEVTDVQVVAGELAPVIWQQLDLFAAANPIDHRLSDLLDNLVTRFGSEDIYRISVGERDHWLPEERFVIEEVSVA